MATAEFSIVVSVPGADQAEANQNALDGARDFCKAVLGELDSSLFGQSSPGEATIDGWDKTKLDEAITWYVNVAVLRAKVRAFRRAALQAAANAQAAALPDWTDDSPIT